MCINKKRKKKKNNEQKIAFSKILLIQESILMWIITISFIILAFLCVLQGMSVVDIAFLTVLPGVAWAAYGASQAFYYKKAEKENTKDGIIYETAMLEAAEGFVDETVFNSDEYDDGK